MEKKKIKKEKIIKKQKMIVFKAIKLPNNLNANEFAIIDKDDITYKIELPIPFLQLMDSLYKFIMNMLQKEREKPRIIIPNVNISMSDIKKEIK